MLSLTLQLTAFPSEKFTGFTSDAGMTVQDVADYLWVSQLTVDRLVVGCKLPDFRVGMSWRLQRADVDGWIAAKSSAGYAITEGEIIPGL